ncbi:uncharacterized protein LOC126284779 [Schistocerca gregaria]|uniref:uncharacterized protein LOC126284779 n=1 Tax=Schistocerca gregaria TaxID=7010 RepID=UPI00211E8EC5|nr:uncharacterized protein LOC126284779 [Schistocerca gregaria]
MVSVASPLLLLLVALASVGARDLYRLRQHAGADEGYGSAADVGDENYELPELLAADPTHGLVGTGLRIKPDGRQAGAAPSLGSILTALGTAGLGGLLTPLLGQTVGGLLGSSLGSGLGALASSLGLGGAAGGRRPAPLQQDFSTVIATRLAEKPQSRPANHHLPGNEDEQEHALHYEAYLVQVPGLGPCIVLAPQQQTSGGHYSEQALATPLGPVSLKPFQPPHQQDFHDHDHHLEHEAPAPPLKKPAGAARARPAASRLNDLRDAYQR